MSRYVNVQIHLSQHAYSQYSNRVEQISYEQLQDNLREQLINNRIGYDRRNYIHLAGVWWVYELNVDKMTIVTCYGRTNMNVPKALGWAARNKDRIDLNSLV